jgi:uncharacterized membrane protein
MIPGGFFIVLTAASYILHSVMVKYSAGKIDPYTGIFVWSCSAFLVGLLSLAYGRLHNISGISASGVCFLIIAGCAIATGSLGYLLAFQKGLDFSFATPLVNISVVMGGLLFGFLLFGEHITATRVIGVVLGAASIILLTRR